MSPSCSASPHPTNPYTPFASVEDAWFWTIGAMQARADGGRSDRSRVARPCDPDDVLRCVERLYQVRGITSRHAHVLRVWGEQQMPPSQRRAGGSDNRLWREAMDCLAPMLRQKGIVA
jgi:hypothetical protein